MAMWGGVGTGISSMVGGGSCSGGGSVEGGKVGGLGGGDLRGVMDRDRVVTSRGVGDSSVGVDCVGVGVAVVLGSSLCEGSHQYATECNLQHKHQGLYYQFITGSRSDNVEKMSKRLRHLIKTVEMPTEKLHKKKSISDSLCVKG